MSTNISNLNYQDAILTNQPLIKRINSVNTRVCYCGSPIHEAANIAVIPSYIDCSLEKFDEIARRLSHLIALKAQELHISHCCGGIEDKENISENNEITNCKISALKWLKCFVSASNLCFDAKTIHSENRKSDFVNLPGSPFSRYLQALLRLQVLYEGPRSRSIAHRHSEKKLNECGDLVDAFHEPFVVARLCRRCHCLPEPVDSTGSLGGRLNGTNVGGGTDGPNSNSETCICHGLVVRTSRPTQVVLLDGDGEAGTPITLAAPPSLHFALTLLLTQAELEVEELLSDSTNTDGNGDYGIDSVGCDVQIERRGNPSLNMAPATLAVLKNWFDYLIEGRLQLESKDALPTDIERPSFFEEIVSPLEDDSHAHRKFHHVVNSATSGTPSRAPFYVVVVPPASGSSLSTSLPDVDCVAFDNASSRCPITYPTSPSPGDCGGGGGGGGEARLELNKATLYRLTTAWEEGVRRALTTGNALQIDMASLVAPLSSSMATDKVYHSQTALEAAVDSILEAWRSRCRCSQPITPQNGGNGEVAL